MMEIEAPPAVRWERVALGGGKKGVDARGVGRPGALRASAGAFVAAGVAFVVASCHRGTGRIALTITR
jgi:hypothetical protein